MDEVFSHRALVLVALFAVVVIIVTFLSFLIFPKSKITFCDVGQGDAIHIRTRDGVDILVDAGEGRDILDCLGKAMPFYDRTIELAFVTHPHIDHYGGFLHIAERYSITLLFNNTGAEVSEAQAYAHFMDILEVVPYGTAVQGDIFSLSDEISLYVLWPSDDMLEDRLDDVNEYSLILHYKEGLFDMLLTGDAPPRVLTSIEESIDGEDIEVLKVPHHGSREGLTETFLSRVSPELSVISVGETNRYDHPSDDILDMLTEQGVRYLMTSDQGSIVMRVHPDGTFSL